MGKLQGEHYSLPTNGGGSDDTEAPNSSNETRGYCGCLVNGLFGLKCLLVLLLGVSVFLSAAFWIPPLSKLSDPGDLDFDPRFRGHHIVASFKLEKSISFLQDNLDQLESDIFDEIQVPNAKVVILYLDDYPRSNITNVVFAVDPKRKHSRISAAARSLIRASFESLVTRQSYLTLTTSVFGTTYFFEVLKFSGGFTIVPVYQKAFPLQETQVRFNFTLNFSIYEVQKHFRTLESQLKSGLHLTSYENLYVILGNRRGSTLSPPVTVQASVLLAVGITPAMPRLKQLAQAIKGPHSRNLGLNNTVFGKVKQVSLSSILQHSLNGAAASGSSVPVPAPAPSQSLPMQPHLSSHHYHHHHHHEHLHHDSNPPLSPSRAPSHAPVRKPPSVLIKGSPHTSAPTPTPMRSYHHAGSGHQYDFRRKHAGTAKHHPLSPAVAPRISPHHSKELHGKTLHPPAASPVPVSYQIQPSSPLPHVVLAHHQPSSGSKSDAEPPDDTSLMAPSPLTSGARVTLAPWLFSFLAALLLHLHAG